MAISALQLTFERQVPTYGHLHGSRQPLGMYNTSLGVVLKRFDALLAKVSDAFSNEMPPDGMLEDLDALLDSMMEHMEQCVGVLRCFFSDAQAAQKHSAVRRYKKGVDDYRNHIAKIVNGMKHRQCQLRWCGLRGDGWISPGYFVEGVIANNALGPDLIVHPQMDGYSFSRDIPFHLFYLYDVSSKLAEAVQAVTGLNLPTPIASMAHRPAQKIVEQVAAIPRYFFFCEALKPVPWIQAVTSGADVRMYASGDSPGRFLVTGRGEAFAALQGDGTSFGFQLPRLTAVPLPRAK